MSQYARVLTQEDTNETGSVERGLTAVPWLIHLIQRSPTERLKKFGFYSVLTASALTLAADIAMLAAPGFPWGDAAWPIGIIVVGVTALRSKNFPRFVGSARGLLSSRKFSTASH